MATIGEKLEGRQHEWRAANVRLLPSAVLFIAGADVSAKYGHVAHGSAGHKIVAIIGIIFFVFFATAFIQVLTKTISRLVSKQHLSVGRAAALQFVLRLIGYIAIALSLLDLLGIPVGKLLLGGAAVGIILGVAAQQALANLFASVVIIISHPFSVGQVVTINSGGLGGTYIGKIIDIGLTHTKLRLQDEARKGSIALLPNAALLSGATIIRGVVTEN